MKEDLILIGAGGYAKSVLDSVDFDKYNFIGFLDSFKDGSHLGYPILGCNMETLENRKNYVYFISIGDNESRSSWYKKLVAHNLRAINIIDKSAIVSKESSFGTGVFVGKMAIVNADVIIGNNVVLNTKSLVEHGARVGDHSNISTNTTLNGDVKIGAHCFIGSSSVVNGQLTVGDYAVVGSGSVVIHDVADHAVVAGVPAKVIRSKEHE